MNADRVKVNLSSADVMAAAGTVARRPEVGRCRRRVSGSAVKKKKKKNRRKKTEQAGKKGTSRMRTRVGMHLYGSVCERDGETRRRRRRKERELAVGRNSCSGLNAEASD